MNRYIIYALITVILISFGQVLFKFSSKDLKVENIHDIIVFILNKYLIFAIMIYIISTALWIFTLSKMELGFSYLLLSLSYPLILILSHIFFQEEISSYKLFSILLILLANAILLYGDQT
jgi:drug/metabolite transporter (DMT)-like permease